MTSDKLLVMIHGSGVVRAGQWARRLIINEDLDKGTMLPFIAHARETGWGVVVMNTNMNTAGKTDEDIPGSESPEDHANTVWENIVAKSDAKNIVIIAHSYGGVVAMELARSFKADFLDRVSGVFMTDSVHYKLSGDKEVDKKLEKIGKNYVGSDLEVGTPVEKMVGSKNIPRFSAGHEKHEWTSWSAMEEIFKDMEKAGKEDIEKVNQDEKKEEL
jgi:pimeloyl-ACP methyl ester carboxylesterase